MRVEPSQMGLLSLVKRPQRATLPLPPSDDKARSTIYEPEGGPSPDTESAFIWDLGLLELQIDCYHF